MVTPAKFSGLRIRTSSRAVTGVRTPPPVSDTVVHRSLTRLPAPLLWSFLNKVKVQGHNHKRALLANEDLTTGSAVGELFSFEGRLDREGSRFVTLTTSKWPSLFNKTFDQRTGALRWIRGFTQSYDPRRIGVKLVLESNVSVLDESTAQPRRGRCRASYERDNKQR